jgi:hypothetical protein
MPAGCRDLQCPFDIFLSFYFTEIKFKIILALKKFFPGINGYRLQAMFIIHKTDQFGKVPDAIYRQGIHHTCFPAILFGDYQSLEAFLAGGDSNGQCAFYRVNRSVEVELAHDHIIF